MKETLKWPLQNILLFSLFFLLFVFQNSKKTSNFPRRWLNVLFPNNDRSGAEDAVHVQYSSDSQTVSGETHKYDTVHTYLPTKKGKQETYLCLACLLMPIKTFTDSSRIRTTLRWAVVLIYRTDMVFVVFLSNHEQLNGPKTRLVPEHHPRGAWSYKPSSVYKRIHHVTVASPHLPTFLSSFHRNHNAKINNHPPFPASPSPKCKCSILPAIIYPQNQPSIRRTHQSWQSLWGQPFSYWSSSAKVCAQLYWILWWRRWHSWKKRRGEVLAITMQSCPSGRYKRCYTKDDAQENCR